MVNNEGQLYTIEGVAAAILMVFTAYLVLSSTNLYTQGDTRISDMQLEQLGNDVLRTMDTPTAETAPSMLEDIVKMNNPAVFNATFKNLANIKTDVQPDNLKINATIYYRDQPPQILYADPYFRENAVKVSRWVRMNNSGSLPGTPNQTVLLEVLLWRS
jgi:hypothetical protein